MTSPRVAIVALLAFVVLAVSFEKADAGCWADNYDATVGCCNCKMEGGTCEQQASKSAYDSCTNGASCTCKWNDNWEADGWNDGCFGKCK